MSERVDDGRGTTFPNGPGVACAVDLGFEWHARLHRVSRCGYSGSILTRCGRLHSELDRRAALPIVSARMRDDRGLDAFAYPLTWVIDCDTVGLVRRVVRSATRERQHGQHRGCDEEAHCVQLYSSRSPMDVSAQRRVGVPPGVPVTLRTRDQSLPGCSFFDRTSTLVCGSRSADALESYGGSGSVEGGRRAGFGSAASAS